MVEVCEQHQKFHCWECAEVKRDRLREALEKCKRLAIERVRTADAAVKKDVYAADALMGIATVARDALAAIRGGD